MGLVRSVLLKSSESQWLARNLPRYAFSRRAVRRFMPGEELNDALVQCQEFAQVGVGTVITRLGENISTIHEADDVHAHYLAALADIERRALPTHLSVKLTQLGLDVSPEQTNVYLHSITSAAAAHGAPVWIDMEGSRYTEMTIEVFRRVRENQENVGICLQAYLKRTTRDLDELLRSTTAIRLVKGAYQEPASIAIPARRDVDENYFACAIRLLEAAQQRTIGYVPAFATHDVSLIERICERAQQLGLSREAYEFQMLYGIRPQEQKRLASEGYRLRVLISYGSAWFAWYMRRLAERPANVWFVMRSVLSSQ